MAQYYYEFPGDYTSLSQVVDDFDFYAGLDSSELDIFSTYVQLDQTTAEWGFMTPKGLVATDTVEILAKGLKEPLGAPMEVAISSADNQNYRVFTSIAFGNIRVYRHSSGTQSTIGSVSTSIDVEQDYWVRFKRSGSNWYLKVWQDGNAEPSSWSLTGTMVSSAYLFGIATQSTNKYTYKQYSVGTNGDAAPIIDPNILPPSAVTNLQATLL